MESLYEVCEWAVKDYSGSDNESDKEEFDCCCNKLGYSPDDVVAVCERAVDENRETTINQPNTPTNARRALWAVAVLVGTI